MAVTHYLPPPREGWSRAYDGAWETGKPHDATMTYTFNRTRELPSGVTISSVSWTDVDGVTLTNASTSSPSHSVTVAGVGEATAVITLSNGDIRYDKRRWRSTDSPPDRGTDYGR